MISIQFQISLQVWAFVNKVCSRVGLLLCLTNRIRICRIVKKVIKDKYDPSEMISTHCGIVGWVNANYFYYTMDNWQALCEGKPPSNGLIRWHAAISLRLEFQIVSKLHEAFLS